MTITTLDGLKGLPSFTYLATPYSKYPGGINEAAKLAGKAAAVFMNGGHRIFCPIAHSNSIGLAGEIDNRDWVFWKRQDEAFMRTANGLIVLKMEGWEESVGVTDEIGAFEWMGKPIIYVHPAEVGL